MLTRLLLAVLSHLSTPHSHAVTEPASATWVRHVVDANDHPHIEKGNSLVVDSVVSAQ